MKRKRNLIAGIVLGTATAVAVLTSSPTPNQIIPTTAESEFVSPTESDFCGYQWAYHSAPELSKSFDAAIKALNPEAEGRAEFFGEDCIHTDGTSTFGAMETDFYVRLPVEDLSKEDDFGNWAAQVMEIVIAVPREELQGPKDGFVEFTFEKNDMERIIFRIPIQQYKSEAQGKSGTELFKLFYNQP